MAIEINLATYDKQEAILSNLDGGVTFMYMLAKSDSTASQSDIEALKEIPHIKNIANSSTAMEAVANSSMAMEAVLNSSTAMNMINANSIAIAKIVAKLAGLNTSDYANMEAVANSSTAMEAVANSSVVMEAVANSSTAMEAVLNSSTAMEALLNSKNTKTLSENNKTITGKFLPLKASVISVSSTVAQAYNGKWSTIGPVLGGWLKANKNNPIATKIKHGGASYSFTTTYYNLNV